MAAVHQNEQQFSDFTTPTALERFIAALETCLTTWRDKAELGRQLSCHAQQHAVDAMGREAPRLQAQLQHRLPFRAEPYTLTLYLPPLPPHQLMPAHAEGSKSAEPTARGPGEAWGQWTTSSSSSSSCGRRSTALPPVVSGLELRDAPHRLQQWFGIRAFLLLTPDSYSGRVLDEEEAHTLLSAAAVALSHAHITWPLLLPVHDAVRDCYRGVAVGAVVDGSATFQLDTDSLHSSRLPPRLLLLDQQLLLFARQLAVTAAPAAMAACHASVGGINLDAPTTSMAADAAAAGASLGSCLGWAPASAGAVRIAVAVRQCYALSALGEGLFGEGSSSWGDEPAASTRAGEWDEGAPWRPWAAQADPIGCLELDLVWRFPTATAALQAQVAVAAADNQQPGVAGAAGSWAPAQATDWRLLALSSSYERDSGHRGFVLRPVEKPRRFLQLQSITDQRARLIQLDCASAAPAALPGDSSFFGMLLSLLESCKWAARAPALGTMSSADWWPQQGAYLPPSPPVWVLQEAIRDIFQLPVHPNRPSASSATVAWPVSTAGQHGCLGKAAPLGALVSRFALHALALGSPRAVAELWSRFVGTLRQVYWEQRRALPRMRLDHSPHQQQEQQEEGAEQPQPERDVANGLRCGSNKRERCRPPAPALQYSLLHQKLQLLDLCIDLQQELQGQQMTGPHQQQQAAPGDEGWEGTSIADAEEQQLLDSPGSSSSSSYFSAAAGSDARISPDKAQQAAQHGLASSACAAAASLGGAPSADSSWPSLETAEPGPQQQQQQGGPAVRDAPHPQNLCEVSSAEPAGQQPEGVAGVLPGITLHLHRDCPLRVPVVHEPPPQTEDLIAERQAALQSLANVGQEAVPAAVGAQLQGRMLLSDMQAFKAANPDFVRWHSPKDCCQSANGGWELSERMATEGNTWQQLWLAAPPVPAAAQRPLFDAELEGERALHFLETLPPPALFADLLSVGFSAAVQLLRVAGHAAELDPVRQQLDCLVAVAGPALHHGVDAACSIDDEQGGAVTASWQQGQGDAGSNSPIQIDSMGGSGGSGSLQRLPFWVPAIYGSGLSSSSYRRLLLLLGCTEQAVVAAHSLLMRLGCSHTRHQQAQPDEAGGDDTATEFATTTAKALVAAALGEQQQQPSRGNVLQEQCVPATAAVAAAAAVDLSGPLRKEMEALLTQPLEWLDSESQSEHGSAGSARGAGRWPDPFQREWLLEVHSGSRGECGARDGAAAGTETTLLQRMYVKALPSEVRIATAISCELA